MPRRDRERLVDMRQAASKALALAEGRAREDLDKDEMLALSLTRLPEIVGEAANHVSEETRTSIDRIPWEDVAGMRHKLIHAYFDVDLDIVWKTVSKDLPALVDALDEVLEEA